MVANNLAWWHENGFVEQSRRAITTKLATYGLTFENEFLQEVAYFVDCNCEELSVTGGGPAEEGVDAARWDDEVQRAFYNGWKSIHGLKHQTIDIAHGITIDIHGPTSLRRSDLHLLGSSNINGRLAELGNKKAYGDSIYPHLSNVTSSNRAPYLTAREKLENRALKKVRISIEWNYGVTSGLFGYLKNLNKLRLMETTRVAKVYTVGTLLRNCHVCLYGSISSSYFGLEFPPDMLEKYLRVPGY